jgi:uncharacterized OsmC-like protein
MGVGIAMGEETLNGMDVRELREYIQGCDRDPAQAERNPVLVAKWLGGSRAQIDFGNSTVHMGGDEDPSAMKMLLACLAACDVEVVATHASLMGLRIEDLEIEARGHFNIRRLLGLEGPAPGYDRLSYTVRVRAPGATDEQIARLKEVCERSSPVGDSFAKSVPPSLQVEVVR